jgi:hypothetical protein
MSHGDDDARRPSENGANKPKTRNAPQNNAAPSRKPLAADRDGNSVVSWTTPSVCRVIVGGSCAHARECRIPALPVGRHASARLLSRTRPLARYERGRPKCRRRCYGAGGRPAIGHRAVVRAD